MGSKEGAVSPISVAPKVGGSGSPMSGYGGMTIPSPSLEVGSKSPEPSAIESMALPASPEAAIAAQAQGNLDKGTLRQGIDAIANTPVNENGAFVTGAEPGNNLTETTGQLAGAGGPTTGESPKADYADAALQQMTNNPLGKPQTMEQGAFDGAGTANKKDPQAGAQPQEVDMQTGQGESGSTDSAGAVDANKAPNTQASGNTGEQTENPTQPLGQDDKDKPQNDAKPKAGSETDGQANQKPAEQQKQGTESSPQEADKKKPETAPVTDADKDNKIKALEEKVANRTATADELKELRDLKQDPEAKRKALEQKLSDGTITDQEIEELGRMNSAETNTEQTPEQKLEELNQKAEALGMDFMEKFARGEMLSLEDLNKLRDLRSEAQLIQNGFSPEQAKAAMREAVKGQSRDSDTQQEKIKSLQEKIQELMSIELQMMSIPKNIKELSKQRAEVRKEANTARAEAESAKTPEERLSKKGREYSLYMQIANINSAMVSQKYLAMSLDAQRIDLEQYIRRKTGASSGIGALVEFAGAKANNVITEVTIATEEKLDSVFGVE